jgi:hypothetical protein
MAALIAAGVGAMGAMAQVPAPHASGTVKAISANGVTVSTSTGQDVMVSVPATANVLVVAPGSRDLRSAVPGSLSDIAVADKVIVMGTAGDAASSLTAVRVILMKSQAIADTHSAENAAWAQGGGGIVRSVDAGDGKIVVASGLKTMMVMVTPATIVRRYSGDSVRFADAQASTVAAIRPGDQLRVRGSKSADGSSITADELVTGSFHNYSGLISSIDATAGTVMLKDLATKKTVTVAIRANSDVRRIPAGLAMRVAMQMKGSAPAAAVKPTEATTPGGAPDGAQRIGRAGTDLSSMLSRLPTETLAGLKVGDAVMIVATAGAADADTSTAVTLLAGVDAILSAAPSGQTMTLSPWSVGSDAAGMGDGGGGGGR